MEVTPTRRIQFANFPENCFSSSVEVRACSL
uniref:Uncharacterized protein n=1 Tax=Lepeophtheirus salmonis TaxID=72036 RepID=A0A0K2VKG7_LEPSM